MAINTYATLQTAITNWLDENPGTDRVKEFISLAEARLNRRVADMRLEARATATLNAEYLELPTDFLAHVAVSIQGDIDYPLEYISPQYIRTLDNSNTAGLPRYYTIVDDQFQFLPAPDSSYTIEIIYRRKIPALSDSATENWFLDEHPDIYLAGSLAHAGKYLRDDADAQSWKNIWDEGLMEIKRHANKRRLGAQPLIMRPGVVENVRRVR